MSGVAAHHDTTRKTLGQSYTSFGEAARTPGRFAAPASLWVGKFPRTEASGITVAYLTVLPMTIFAHTPQMNLEPPAHGIGLHDRVSVPGGGVGSVIGFYHRADETVLVLFASGDSREYAPAELQRRG